VVARPNLFAEDAADFLKTEDACCLPIRTAARIFGFFVVRAWRLAQRRLREETAESSSTYFFEFQGQRTMHDRYQGRRFWTAVGAAIAGLLLSASAHAQTVTWGVNGVGGSGNWDTTTKNWFNGASNVAWPSGGNAIFAGAAGGTVHSFVFGPVVSSMTFNTPGYVVQNGWIESGASGLTVTTYADATISSTLSDSTIAGNFLIKNGPAALTVNGTNFFGSVQVNQGEFRIGGSSTLFYSDVVLGNTAGATVTLGQNSSSTEVKSLSGGGALGGIVQPDNQARTVTLYIGGSGVFGGKLQDNGGQLALSFITPGATETLTNANNYSGPTTIFAGTVALTGNGTAPNSAFTINGGSTLVLDNSSAVAANRISNSIAIALRGGEIQFSGNNSTPVEEVAGQLNIGGASKITVTQPTAAATQMSFAGLQRGGHAILHVVGPGVSFAGLTNGATGIVAPFVTAGNEWATIGGDGRIAPWSAYATDINAGSTGDHVKLSANGTTSLAASTTRASLNLQNSDALASQVLDLAGQSLKLTSGGILSSGAGGSTISHGSLSTTAQELVVTANNNLTISSSIVESSGATTLTKAGAGVLTLSGVNTYAGPTTIVEGTLAVASDASLGVASSLDLAGGTLRAAGDFSSPKSISSSGAVVGSIDTAGFNVTFSGANNGALNKIGPGTLTLTNPTTGQNYAYAGVYRRRGL
jgi:fibronectin-binding autotransporter adhesin